MAWGDTKAPEKEPPANIEAEQALLGVLLCDSADKRQGLGLVPPELTPLHFYEPFHQRLYGRIETALKAGRVLDIALGDSLFRSDPAYLDLGGVSYLADLVDKAPPATNAIEYGRAIIDAAARRRLVNLAKDILERAHDSGVSAEDLTTEIAEAVTGIGSSTATVQLVSADEALDGVMDYIDNPAGHAQGILTGLQPLDDKLGPWLPGDLIALAGRPGAGKSAEAGIISMNVALSGMGVIEIHAEMTVQQAWRRRLTAMAFSIAAEQAPNYSGIRKRTITYDQHKALEAAREKLRGIPLMAVKRTGISLGRLRALVARQKMLWARQGISLGLVVIDHAGLVTSGKDFRSRVDEQTAVSNGLKEMADADDLNVAMLALLQLSRGVEQRDDKRPQLPDLRDSGSWEQDCDVVIGAYRESYYAAREQEPKDKGGKGGAEWAEWARRKASPWIDNILLKVREGETDSVRLWANMGTNTILGAAPQEDFFGGF